MPVQKINKLKKEKNAVILAHCYQNLEVDEVADYVGDSLYLSRMAAETDADIIVFAGVFFMAQTAKILSPNKKVLLPRLESGCLMADMVNPAQLREFKAKHPGLPVVCYVNSTAGVKSECDICCTSSNAVKIVKSLNAKEVLFLPDTYLGKYVESQLDGVNVITYPGFCPTHLRIRPEDVISARKKHPGALVLAHPECHKAVADLADYVGSTTGIMDFAAKSSAKTFIIATEKGVADRLQRDFGSRHCEPAEVNPLAKQSSHSKEFILIKEDIVCPNMKWHTLDDIYNSLEFEQHEITVDEDIAAKALGSIERMMEVS
ncbi:MAG: quinolinate synthase NadA [Heliobacteriaceae bacterium]|nr:quinolinate synthase NadA [Heliobacteriaceae bacterium]